MTDPRRKIDERAERLRSSKVPFVESYREIVLEGQPLGAPIEREIIVLRVDKSQLKLYAGLAVFVVVILVLSVVFAG